MKRQLIFPIAGIFAIFFNFNTVFAQFLPWTYHNLYTNQSESGDHINLKKDSQGNLHLLAWDKFSEHLVYHFKAKNSSDWTKEYVDSSGFNGVESALFIDQNDNLHIAYLENISGQAHAKYAKKIAGAWVIDTFISRPLGNYYLDKSDGNFRVHSIDLTVGLDSVPHLAFFDSRVYSSIDNNPCNYELELQYAFLSDTGWISNTLGDLRHNFARSCPGGEPYPSYSSGKEEERYGEDVQLFFDKNGTLKAVNMAYVISGLLLFDVDTHGVWMQNYTKIDSIPRLINSHAVLTFDGIQLKQSPDSIFHLTYSTSTFRGSLFDQVFGPLFDQHTRLWYTKFDPSDSTTTYTEVMGFGTDSSYAAKNALEIIGNDTVLIAYPSREKGRYELAISTNGGSTFTKEIIDYCTTPTSRPGVSMSNDTIYVTYYNTDSKNLKLAFRPFLSATWQYKNLSVSEDKGFVSHSEVFRPTNSSDYLNDTLSFSFYDNYTGQLFYGHNNSVAIDTLSYELIDTTKTEYESVQHILDKNLQKHIIYYDNQNALLKYAKKVAGNWQNSVIDTLLGNSAFSLAYDTVSDKIYVTYYESTLGALAVASKTSSAAIWQTSIVDSSAGAIIGQYSDVFVNQNNSDVHISYFDQTKDCLKHAKLSGGLGSWQIDSIYSLSNAIAIPSKILADSFGVVSVVCKNTMNNSLVRVYSDSSGANWQSETIFAGTFSSLNNQFDIKFDSSGYIWLLCSTFDGIDNLQLLRQSSSVWSQVVLNNNEGLIGSTSDLNIVGRSIYVSGYKTKENGTGLAYLHTDIDTVNANENLITDDFNNAVVKNYPNPMQNQTKFGIFLPENASVNLDVYDLNGKNVANILKNTYLTAGDSQVNWQNHELPNGVYVYKLQSKQFQYSGKLIIIR